MKKFIVIILMFILLCGCGAETIEVNGYIAEELNISDCENADFQKGIQNIDAVFENEDFSFRIIQSCTFGKNIYFVAESEKFSDLDGKQLCVNIEKLMADDREIDNYGMSYLTVFEDSEKDYYFFRFSSEEFFEPGEEITLFLKGFFVIENEYTDRFITDPVELSWNLEKVGETRYFESHSGENEVKYIEVSPFSLEVEFEKHVEEIPEIYVIYSDNEAKIKIDGEPETEEFYERIKSVKYYFGEMLDLSKIKYIEVGEMRYILSD